MKIVYFVSLYLDGGGAMSLNATVRYLICGCGGDSQICGKWHRSTDSRVSHQIGPT